MKVFAMLLLLVVILSPSVHAQDSYVPSACTHYAANNGSGSSCTWASPCTIESFWNIAAAGHTLCLKAGTYTESIAPPGSLKGTSSNPITVRALEDGQVTIDAQNGGFAVLFSGTGGSDNDWFVVDGINAKNGLESLLRMSGDNNVMRRVIGYDGTSGESDSNIFRVTGQNNQVSDCAGWGVNSRKIMDVAQGGNVGGTGFRRCWAEWNDHPQGESQPNNTWLIAYNTGNARFYNNIGTWRKTGQIGNAEGIMEIAVDCDGSLDGQGTIAAGFVNYLTPGFTYDPGHIVHGFCASNFTLVDIAAIVPSGFSSVRPFIFDKGGSGQPSGSVCNNCLAVHNGSASTNTGDSGWTLNDFHEGSSLSAATGGTSAFTLLPSLCTRYVGDTLTSTPVWPFPMNLRVKQARAANGVTVVDVNQAVISNLGSIPSGCIATSDRANVGGRTVGGEFIMGPIEAWSTRSKVTASIEAGAHSNSAITLLLTLEVSYNEGSSWAFVASASRKGGAVLDDQGNTQPNLYLTTRTRAEQGGLRRQYRAKVNLASGTYVSNGGFIEAVD